MKSACLNMGRVGKNILFIALLIIFTSSFVIAQDKLSLDRENRLLYGKVVYITGIVIEPKEIAPGSDGEIVIEFENIAESELKDFTFRLYLPSQFSPAIGDLVEKKMRVIGGYERKNLSFKVTALADAAPGIYSFPIKMRYINSIGDYVEENNTMSLAIGAKPEMLVRISESEIYRGNLAGVVTLNFVNKGLVNIKFLTVEMGSRDDFVILSSDKYYLGDVESDDFEEAEFKIKLLYDKESITLPLKIDYRDAENRLIEENIELELKIPDKEDVKKDNSYYYMIIGGIGLGVFILVYIIFKIIRMRRER